MSFSILRSLSGNGARSALAQARKSLPDLDRRQLAILLAFAAVYFFWGSTYLAIRFAIETIPPFLMAGTRFVLAGALLYGWAHLRGAERPQLRHVRTAIVTGGLMLLGGNSVLVWAEQYVPSGLAALLVATVPLWVVVINGVENRQRPETRSLAGVLLGLAGIVILVGPQQMSMAPDGFLLGVVAVNFGAFSWALGTVYSRRAPQPSSQVMAIGLNMLAGGVLVTLFGAASGEFARLELASISLKSWLAVVYLLAFGSLIGYSAYMWLVKETTASQASSNFYVNPVIAVLLGWLLAGEVLDARTLVAATVIVAAVVLIVSRPRPQREVAAGVEVEGPPCAG